MSLDFRCGVVGSGKTTELAKTYEIYSRKKLKPVVIKPIIDDREGSFSGWGFTASRIMKDVKIPAYYFKDIAEIKKLQYGVLIVDEAQFLSRSDVLFLANIAREKKVIAFGLKSDVNGNLFEGSSALLCFSDRTKEIESVCEMPNCQNNAVLHLRMIDGVIDRSKEPILIEKGNIKYIGVCRNCWLKTME